MTAHDEQPRDPALARRYREAAEQSGMAPPPALDAQILAAARTAVRPPAAAPHPFPRPWWRRLALPAGVMATTVLAVMLSLTVQRHTPETLESERHERHEQRASQAPAAAGEIREAAPPAGPVPATERAAAAGVVPVAPPVLTDSAPRSVEKKAMPKRMPPPAAPAAMSAPSAPPEAAAPAASNEAATALPRQKMEAAGRSAEAEARVPLQLQRATPAAAAPARQDAAKGDAPGAAQAWIEEIRELRRQGRDEDAARRLAEFRKAYPGYLLPEDLR